MLHSALVATGSSALVGAAVAAAACVAAAPYLARLTVTVPDRDAADWWRGAPVDRSRRVRTASFALLLGALAGAAAGWSALLPAFVALAVFGAPLTVIDYDHHRLPNRLVYPAAVAAAVLLTLAAAVRGEWPDLARAAGGATATYAVLFVLRLISPRSFGGGDVRLGGVLGGYLGYQGWIAVYYGIFAGFLLGSVISLALIAVRRATMKTAIAFGPMLLLGTVLVLALDLTPSLVG